MAIILGPVCRFPFIYGMDFNLYVGNLTGIGLIFFGFFLEEPNWNRFHLLCLKNQTGIGRGPKLECYADKMREILPKIGWLLLL